MHILKAIGEGIVFWIDALGKILRAFPDWFQISGATALVIALLIILKRKR